MGLLAAPTVPVGDESYFARAEALIAAELGGIDLKAHNVTETLEAENAPGVVWVFYPSDGPVTALVAGHQDGDKVSPTFWAIRRSLTSPRIATLTYTAGWANEAGTPPPVVQAIILTARAIKTAEIARANAEAALTANPVGIKKETHGPVTLEYASGSELVKASSGDGSGVARIPDEAMALLDRYKRLRW